MVNGAIKADKSTKTRNCLPNSGNAAILGMQSQKLFGIQTVSCRVRLVLMHLADNGFFDKATTTSLPELRQNINSAHWRFLLSLNLYIITSDLLVQLCFFQLPHSHYSIFLGVTAYLLYMLHLQLHK